MKTLLQIFLVCFTSVALGQTALPTINLPPRSTQAMGGHTIVEKIMPLPFAAREKLILDEVLSGNVPEFYRHFCPVTVTNVSGSQTNVATFYAAPECLMVGTDKDYLIIPVSPNTAQFIADRLNCVLPTPKMSDDIYAAAEVKLVPAPIPASPAMTTAPVFAQHNDSVRQQREGFLPDHPLGVLTAGYKKDLVITTRLANLSHKVAIYGWHRTNGVPIQPLYTGHISAWVDYSQGTRLISSAITVNGQPQTIPAVLADSKLCGLLSNEGVITNGAYPTNPILPVVSVKMDLPWPQKFTATTNFGEWIREINLGPDGRILIDAPATNNFSPDKTVLLVFYALPNGSTIEQTFGKKLAAGDDWHFDIQHIGAQTRWLREALPNRTLVVAYLEAAGKSWPAWRHEPGHDDQATIHIIQGVAGIFSAYHTEVALTSHSGGGSFICGWLGAVKTIPASVVRIAFLDSDYAYNRTNHADKLIQWLNASTDHHLSILAYHDAIALLDGKTFVSEAGGTWGRSHAMLEDLAGQLSFTSHTNGNLERYLAREGQAQFLLHENPGKKILHTVQVELNGFIQAMVSGTPTEGLGYTYLGTRSYSKWIQDQAVSSPNP